MTARGRLPVPLALAAFAAALVAKSAAPQFRSETRAVLVDVSVTRDGAVRGLGEADFELLVAGERTPFRMLDPESLPLAVLFAMDESGSTRGDRRRRLAEGARFFAGALTERDACGVTAFSMAVRWVREFQPCGPAIGERLLQSASGGATALWDGIALSLAALDQGQGRPVLLLFTDGQDNHSWVREDHLRRSVAGSEALFYAIVAQPPRPSRAVRVNSAGFALLEELAEATGGRVLRITSDEGLRAAYQEVLEELRVRYVLAFTPDPSRRGFVPIEVRVRQRGAEVRARAGYAARP